MRYAQLQPLQLKSISSLLVTLFVLFWLVDLYVLKIQCSLACFCFSPLLFSSYWLCSRTYQTNLLSLFPRYTKNAFLTQQFVKILSKCKSYLYFLTYTAQTIWSIVRDRSCNQNFRLYFTTCHSFTYLSHGHPPRMKYIKCILIISILTKQLLLSILRL